MPTASKTSVSRILIAEDSPVARHVVQSALSDPLFDLTFVDNGQDAVELAKQGGFDLILMDIEMPVMDGLTAVRLIRDHEQTVGGRVPIIAVTSNDNEAECLSAGMDGFLPKSDVSSRLRPMLANHWTPLPG